jgi:hypothetical protein
MAEKPIPARSAPGKPGDTDIAKGLAEQAEAARQKPSAEDRIAQLESELAALKTKTTEVATSKASTIIDQEYEAWKKWAGLSAEERTQIAADKAFAGKSEQRMRVSLPDFPSIVVPADDEFEAVTRYNHICGITSIALTDPPVRHSVAVA